MQKSLLVFSLIVLLLLSTAAFAKQVSSTGMAAKARVAPRAPPVPPAKLGETCSLARQCVPGLICSMDKSGQGKCISPAAPQAPVSAPKPVAAPASQPTPDLVCQQPCLIVNVEREIGSTARIRSAGFSQSAFLGEIITLCKKQVLNPGLLSKILDDKNLCCCPFSPKETLPAPTPVPQPAPAPAPTLVPVPVPLPPLQPSAAPQPAQIPVPIPAPAPTLTPQPAPAPASPPVAPQTQVVQPTPPRLVRPSPQSMGMTLEQAHQACVAKTSETQNCFVLDLPYYTYQRFTDVELNQIAQGYEKYGCVSGSPVRGRFIQGQTPSNLREGVCCCRTARQRVTRPTPVAPVAQPAPVPVPSIPVPVATAAPVPVSAPTPEPTLVLVPVPLPPPQPPAAPQPAPQQVPGVDCSSLNIANPNCRLLGAGAGITPAQVLCQQISMTPVPSTVIPFALNICCCPSDASGVTGGVIRNSVTGQQSRTARVQPPQPRMEMTLNKAKQQLDKAQSELERAQRNFDSARARLDELLRQ